MFNAKYVGFLILFTLLACSDNDKYGGYSGYNNNRHNQHRTSPYGGSTYGGAAGMGAPAGVAVLVSNTSARGVTQMTMNIFGTGGKSAAFYNGAAQFTGSMTLSSLYNNNAGVSSYPTPHSGGVFPHSTSYHNTSPGQRQCPSGQIQFNCQGRLLNSTFTCQANLYGGSYRIHGMLGQKQNTSQDYEIQTVEVDGPCTRPSYPVL